MQDLAGGGTPIELRIAVHSDRYDEHDDRWLDQVGALMADLHRDAGVLRQPAPPAATAKGTLDSVVIPILSAGALTATVEALKAWLLRDRSRSVKITWAADGTIQQVELSGRDADNPAYDELVRRALAQLDERPE